MTPYIFFLKKERVEDKNNAGGVLKRRSVQSGFTSHMFFISILIFASETLPLTLLLTGNPE